MLYCIYIIEIYTAIKNTVKCIIVMIKYDTSFVKTG